jgi:hypothetical protein
LRQPAAQRGPKRPSQSNRSRPENSCPSAPIKNPTGEDQTQRPLSAPCQRRPKPELPVSWKCPFFSCVEIVRTGQGKARQGKARQGKARQGKARQGKARTSVTANTFWSFFESQAPCVPMLYLGVGKSCLTN